MLREYFGRFFFIFVIAVVFGTAVMVKGLEYGQDLNGGAEIRYGVESRMSDKLKSYLIMREDISRETNAHKVRLLELSDAEAKLNTATSDKREELERKIERLKRETTYEGVSEIINNLRNQQAQMSQAAGIIGKRLDGAGTEGLEIRTVGRDSLLIRIPYQKNDGETEADARARFQERVKKIKALVDRQGVMTFHIALDSEKDRAPYQKAADAAKEGRRVNGRHLYVLPNAEYDEVVKKLGDTDPVEAGYLTWDKKVKNQRRLLLPRKPAMDGSVIDSAYTGMGQNADYQINFSTKGSGSATFERVTSENLKRPMAIILDNLCTSAPVINATISSGGEITGSFTRTEADNLSQVLTAGSLPIRIEYQQESIVGPSLGKDSIDAGLRAALIGLALVLVFMLVYYQAGGVIANIALVLNMIIIMGAVSAFGVKLSLPGIAGLVLTIGMAVDANVLIFERIREELAKGKALRLAVGTGYDRAFVTIIDANITTLITALILYWLGTGPVKGFAVTLTLGILGSLFASLFASRVFVEFLVAKNIIKKFKMFSLVGDPKFSFMKKRVLAYVFSGLLIVGGAVAFFGHTDKYGIDFVGGTMIVTQLDEEMTDGQMRTHAEAALAKLQAEENATAKTQNRAPLDYGDVRVQAMTDSSVQMETGKTSLKYSLILRMDVHQLAAYRQFLTAELGDKVDEADPFPRQETIGMAVSTELAGAAAKSIIFSLILIFLYIVMRFEFNAAFGVGAVVALLHDVVIVAGAMALADYTGLISAKIDLPAVAALLTIVGYSLNDTIVVFDRIREVHTATGHTKPLREVVDKAVNGVLSRSLITSLTTALAAGSLLVLGGEATRGFSFAIFIGVLVGTYSSIFVASPVVVEWEAVSKKKSVKKGALIGVATLFVVAIITFGVLVASSIKERDRRDGNRDNIVRLSLALSSYAAKHEGAFPLDLTKLKANPDVAPELLTGPEAKTGIAYSYVTGLSDKDEPSNVMLYDDTSHKNGGWVLFVDGELEWKNHRQIKSLVQRTTLLNKDGRSVKVIPASK